MLAEASSTEISREKLPAGIEENRKSPNRAAPLPAIPKKLLKPSQANPSAAAATQSSLDKLLACAKPMQIPVEVGVMPFAEQ